MINYYLITKPGIILGNLFTVAAGFLLASKGVFHFELFFETLLGIALIIASACIFNNYIDRSLDKKMERTKNRPFVTGAISTVQALSIAVVLVLAGMAVLLYFTNILTAVVAAVGFLVYVLLYSLWKVHTIYATAIGSIAGAVPPVVGYCAVSNHLDAGAIILFFILVFWQMPHFYAIAIMHLKDYTKAGIPALPITKGLYRTKLHMTLYTACFVGVAGLLSYFGYTGNLYLLLTTGLGLIWFILCLFGFQASDNTKWSRMMFRYSLVLIMLLCVIIPLDVI